jgi:hypothetical protein
MCTPSKRHADWRRGNFRSAFDPRQVGAIAVLRSDVDLQGKTTWITDTNLIGAGTSPGNVMHMNFDLNSSALLVGTQGDGTFVSLTPRDRLGNPAHNGPRVWRRMRGSEAFWGVTGSFFDERTKDIFIGTQGRGTWRVVAPPESVAVIGTPGPAGGRPPLLLEGYGRVAPATQVYYRVVPEDTTPGAPPHDPSAPGPVPYLVLSVSGTAPVPLYRALVDLTNGPYYIDHYAVDSQGNQETPQAMPITVSGLAVTATTPELEACDIAAGCGGIAPYFQEAELDVAGLSAIGTELGYSVALDGDTAVLGTAPVVTGNATVAPPSGAWVFTRNAGKWSQQQALKPSDGPHAQFGQSLAMSADTLLVGTPDNSFTGAVYVYTRSGGTWSQQQKLVNPDAFGGDNFGYALAISGNTAIVGAIGQNACGCVNGSTFAGAAYVYTRAGSTWSLQQKLLASGGIAYDNFGNSVALAGNTALVGAYGKDNYTGAAYVFTFNGSIWTQQQVLTSSDRVTGDNFGVAVALASGTALVGAPNRAGQAGGLYVFDGTAGSWPQTQEIVPAGASNFGVSIATEGNTAVVGGMRYVLTATGTQWSLKQQLPDPTPNDGAGFSGAISGTTVLLGAPSRNTLVGTAYTFVSP